MLLGVETPDAVDYGLNSPLVGKHNAYNLLEVFATALSLGLPWESTLQKLKAAAGAPGRLQRASDDNSKFQVFVDYAHTHDALKNVLIALRFVMQNSDRLDSQWAQRTIGRTTLPVKQNPASRLICLFGCGGDRDRTKRPKMAKVAETLADFVIVTSDNPRTEDPLAIIDEICTGFSPDWKSAGKITVEPDRRRAIQQAIARAQPGDVVLIAGKGHENYQIIGKTKYPFDDVQESIKALEASPVI